MISRILIHKGRTVCGTIATALLLSALTGCSTEHEVGPGAENAKLITFTPAVSNAAPGTRAAAGHPIENGGNIPEGKSFGVYAYSRPSSTGTAASYDAELPNNTEVTHNGTAFTYSPVAKWPIQNGAELAFYGYYPWQDPTASLTPLVDPVIEVTPRSSSMMWIYYTTPADPANQIDLMYAYTDFSTGFESVDMEFHHALTRINFKARYEDYTQSLQITSITIKDVLPKGLLTVVNDDSSPTWGNLVTGFNADPIDMTLTEDNGLVRNHTLTSTLSWVSVPGSTTETAGDMLVIPQSVQDMVVEVEATIGTNTTPETFTFPLAGTPDWKMNQIVTYEITIAGNGMRITPQIRSNWDDNHIEVIQDGQWWMYVTLDEVEIGCSMSTMQTFSFNTNYPGDKSVSVPEEYSTWLSAQNVISGNDESAYWYYYLAHSTIIPRTGEMHINVGNLTKVIKIHQRGASITGASVTPDDFPAHVSTVATFRITGEFPRDAVKVRVWNNTTGEVLSGTDNVPATTNGSATQTRVVPANPTWVSRELAFQYFDPTIGTEGEWKTIKTGTQQGYNITANATPWTQAGAGTSTVQITGYRPQLQVRAIVDGATMPLSMETVSKDGTGAATLNIPALPGGVNERDIHIEYSHEVPAMNWFPITTFTQTNSNSNSIAGRFARSNIVWDGSKLTFATTAAENTTVAPANAQGVFFKWGSLVAVSPVGVAYNTSQILFSPDDTNNYTWAQIPYADETSGKFGTHNTDEDDFAGYDGNSNVSGPGYTTTGTNANKGDICRYITDRGWVPDGEKWRLPTADEYDQLMAELTSVSNNGEFDNITQAPSGNNSYGNHANGYWQPVSGRWLGKGAQAAVNRSESSPSGSTVYVPAGGCRNDSGSTLYAGNFGYAWSASSYDVAYASYLYLRDYGTNWYSSYRNYAFPVRCIRE